MVGIITMINYILYYRVWFVAVTSSCNAEVANNVTYFVNPNFPGLLNDVGECSLRVKKISKDISQIRLDFVNFNLVSRLTTTVLGLTQLFLSKQLHLYSTIYSNKLMIRQFRLLSLYSNIIVRLQAQPNRKTGVCETDTFVVTGGASNDLRICGLNSGQHGKLFGTRRTTRNCVKSGFTIYTYAFIVQNNNFIARSRSFEALYSRIRSLSRYNIISTTCHHTKLCG